ncbi:MAG: DUF58 domain-containing protein [Bdellovibrio sp.]|nr:DUF58 domain-containing protein [Bdellovibrio sp.]
MNLEQVHKVVASIKANLFKRSNSYSIGKLKSNVRGTGLQFKDYQVYCQGDDIRFIDWKLLARTGHAYVKLYEEERNVEVVIVIDFVPSMLIGSKGILKIQAILEICFLLCLLFKETGDKARLILLCKNPVNLYPLRGEEGISKIILELEKRGILTQDGKINLDYEFSSMLLQQDKINYFYKYLKKNKEIILFSEFDDEDNFHKLHEFLKNKRSHLFKLWSKIDEGEKIPFSIFGRTLRGTKFRDGYFSIGQAEVEKNLKLKKITKIDIDEKYLEVFIKKFL